MISKDYIEEMRKENMKLSISKKIFEKFPDLKVGVLIAKSINNKGTVKLPKPKIPASSDARIQTWNKAYKAFSADPKKHKPSIASLVELAKKGLPKINKLVDIYNYISLKHIVPAGGSDLNKIKGNIYLRISSGKESFTPLHTKQVEYTKPSEVIYSDEEKIITRRWNHKESDLAKFTENTKNAILEIEALPPFSDKELVRALGELSSLIQKNCGGKVTYLILDRSNPTLDIDKLELISQYIEYTKTKRIVEVKKKIKKLSEAEKQVASLIQKATNLKLINIGELIEVPPDPKLGDLAFPCFVLAKKLKKNPNQIAQDLAKKIKPKGIFKEVKAIGPYLNFFYHHGKFVAKVLLAKEAKPKGRKAMVEFPSPNTNKPLHLGHLRNMTLGESVSRILEAQGWKVIRTNLNNDRGIHVCKSMLAYQLWGKNRKPNKKSDHFVGDFYVMFSKKEDQDLEKKAQEMLKKWEDGDKKVLALWKRMNTWAFKGFDETYKRFGISFNKQYYESDMHKKGKQMVLDGVKKKLFYHDEKGAIVFDAGDELGEKVLIRSDGTSLYMTQDLYLAKLKYSNYKMDKSIYVVGNEQDYHFNVLFKVLEKLRKIGYEFCPDNYHLSYGMVFLPEGRMKSREGSVVDADDLIDDMEKLASKEISKRHKISKTKLKELSSKIGLGAIKFFILKYDAKKDMTFNPEESISLEGQTGPYLQYALVRASKIMQKAKAKPSTKNLELLDKPQEFELAKKLAKFPEVVERSARENSPHTVANYAYELAQLFSTFYEKCSVIRAEPRLKAARLALVKAFHQTLKNALDLLGIEEVELM